MDSDSIIGFGVLACLVAILVTVGWAIGSSKATTSLIESPTMTATTTGGVTVVTVSGRVVSAKDAERLAEFWKKVAEEASKGGTDGQ